MHYSDSIQEYGFDCKVRKLSTKTMLYFSIPSFEEWRDEKRGVQNLERTFSLIQLSPTYCIITEKCWIFTSFD